MKFISCLLTGIAPPANLGFKSFNKAGQLEQLLLAITSFSNKLKSDILGSGVGVGEGLLSQSFDFSTMGFSIVLV